MKKLGVLSILLSLPLLTLSPLVLPNGALSDSASTGMLSNIHFLIPAGPGGGRAIAKLIETASRQQNTLMINSTPMVVRSLQKIFPQSFRDLVPIASIIADYSCFVVSKDSPYTEWQQVIEQFRVDPRSVKVAGGSVRGSTDHFIIARAFQLVGGNPRKVIYVPYDGGGKALAGIDRRITDTLDRTQ